MLARCRLRKRGITCCRGCTSSAKMRKIDEMRSVAMLLPPPLLLLLLLTYNACLGASTPLYTLTYVSSCPIFTSKTVLNANASVSGEEWG